MFPFPLIICRAAYDGGAVASDLWTQNLDDKCIPSVSSYFFSTFSVLADIVVYFPFGSHRPIIHNDTRSCIVCLKSAWVRLWPQYYSDISNTPSLNGNLALCYDCKCIFLSGWCTHNAIILGRFSQQCHKTIVVFVIVVVVVFVVADVVCIC